jgi:membrane carboxypeptidase/penicillin-binding protein
MKRIENLYRMSLLHLKLSTHFIAIEDQSFWENGGVDYKGILRAVYSTAKKFIGLDARV